MIMKKAEDEDDYMLSYTLLKYMWESGIFDQVSSTRQADAQTDRQTHLFFITCTSAYTTTNTTHIALTSTHIGILRNNNNNNKNIYIHRKKKKDESLRGEGWKDTGQRQEGFPAIEEPPMHFFWKLLENY